MTPNDEASQHENSDENRKKEPWVFYKHGDTWTNEIVIDWPGTSLGISEAFRESSEME